MKKSEEIKYVKMQSTWYGWASPVGLGLFAIFISLSFLIGCIAINVLVNAGEKGVEIVQSGSNLELKDSHD